MIFEVSFRVFKRVFFLFKLFQRSTLLYDIDPPNIFFLIIHRVFTFYLTLPFIIHSLQCVWGLRTERCSDSQNLLIKVNLLSIFAI